MPGSPWKEFEIAALNGLYEQSLACGQHGTLDAEGLASRMKELAHRNGWPKYRDYSARAIQSQMDYNPASYPKYPMVHQRSMRLANPQPIVQSLPGRVAAQGYQASLPEPRGHQLPPYKSSPPQYPPNVGRPPAPPIEPRFVPKYNPDPKGAFSKWGPR